MGEVDLFKINLYEYMISYYGQLFLSKLLLEVISVC